MDARVSNEWDMLVDALQMVRDRIYPQENFPFGVDYLVFAWLWINIDPEEPVNAGDTVDWIAADLRASRTQVEVALDRLGRVGLIEMLSQGEGRLLRLGSNATGKSR